MNTARIVVPVIASIAGGHSAAFDVVSSAITLPPRSARKGSAGDAVRDGISGHIVMEMMGYLR